MTERQSIYIPALLAIVISALSVAIVVMLAMTRPVSVTAPQAIASSVFVAFGIGAVLFARSRP